MMLQEKIMQLEIEKSALKKETDALSKQRLTKIDADLKELKDSEHQIRTQWEKRKETTCID